MISVLAVCIGVVLSAASAHEVDQKVIDRIAIARELATSKINEIKTEWQVEKYPYFLRAAAMHKSSWEMMKFKYMLKVLSSIKDGQRSKFIVSFLGSSVTAGHDSPFNVSYPVVIGEEMAATFDALNIEFESRNAALGNNPCIPYDICAKAFAGNDADVIHWEQSYFCSSKNWIFEQFIRESMYSPMKPIVVFDTSETGHWEPTKCLEPRALDSKEEALLKADPLHIVAELNRPDYERWFPAITSHHMYKKYEGAGIQTFFHWEIEQYACQGPYKKSWMAGAASWHPSVIGHRLRAHQFAYFWLNIWVDALDSLHVLLEHMDAATAFSNVDEHLSGFYHPLDEPIFPSVFPENAQCFTDYKPRFEPGTSLKDKVISGLAGGTGKKDVGPGWVYIIYEDIIDWHITDNARARGYTDFKWLMYGDKDAGSLSVAFSMERTGPIFICSTPAVWGHLPGGFDTLFSDSAPDVHITLDVADTSAFVFNKDAAVQMEIYHDKANNEMELCSEIRPMDKITAGNHVLTLTAKGSNAVIFAFLVTP